MRKMKFKKLRQYLSRVDRVSICDKNTLSYKNFISIQDVPEEYDKRFVYGIGLIESEFYQANSSVYSAEGQAKDCVLLPCIEIVIV